MAIRPIDEYVGKVTAPTADYPDGKAQNITSPGDGTGTPWEAKLVNDIFGFQQFLTSKAGITPSGTPDNATTSQYFEAIWKLLNVRALTYNIVSDVDLTLTAAQNLYAKITITDTGVVLTTGRNVILDNVGRVLIFTNSTAQTLTVKTAAGTGIAVPAGATATLLNDGVNVVYQLKAELDTLYQPISGTPRASVYLTTATALTSGVTTKVPFNVEEWDVTGAYDKVTNFRFQPTKAGYYKVSVNVFLNSGSTSSSVQSFIYKNGAEYKRGDGRSYASVLGINSSQVNAAVFLNGSTDYIEAYFVAAGSSLNLSNSQSTTYMTIDYLGA